jgi:hypothetical protein
MADELDPAIKEILNKYGLDPKQSLWLLKRKNRQSGQYTMTWIMYHRAVQKAAMKAGIKVVGYKWLQMDLEKKLAACEVTIELDGYQAIDTGESAPYNTKIEQPVAMAQKRAFDRAALQILGLHGFVYSEDEADEFKQQEKETAQRIEKPHVPPPAQRREPAAIINKREVSEESAAVMKKAFETYVIRYGDELKKLPGFYYSYPLFTDAIYNKWHKYPTVMESVELICKHIDPIEVTKRLEGEPDGDIQ